MVGSDGTAPVSYNYTDYGETEILGEQDFYNEVCYGAGIYDKTTGLYYLNARYYSPENGAFLTQDTYRGDRSRTATLNYYSYCAGNPINYTDPSGHAIWGILGAAMGAYDGYKYAKKKKLKGWKKAAAIVGGAALGAVNPFKVVKAAKKVYKAAKYAKKARSTYKKAKSIVKAAKKPKVSKVKVKKAKKQNTAPKKKKAAKRISKSKKKCQECFVAGTKISTEKGFTPIEQIKPGDHVWSEDPETNEKALKKVNKIFVREKDSIIRLSINGEVIETTHEHPFYVEGEGFISAGSLEVGDEVRLQSGDTAMVDSAEEVQLEEPIKVYNFEVEDFHTYYVSEQQVLVHNTCGEKKSIVVAPYNKLKRNKEISGQAHHLSQNAAFESVIPKGKGLAVKLEGNAITDVGSQHYKAHATMESFWDKYRIGGELAGVAPTIGKYNRAMYDSLINAGISKADSAYAVRAAYGQQKAYGLSNSSPVPRIPNRLHQAK